MKAKMKNNDRVGASDTNDSSQSSAAGQHNDDLPNAHETAIALRQGAVIDDEAALLLSREKAVTLREDAVHLREELADARERDFFALETTQAASDNHMVVLQQANEHLVIATLEAQTLAQQVKLTTIQLESAMCVAEKANLAKSEFLSRMTHELRTPLNAILGFAQLLELGSPRPTPVQLVSINKILQAGWYLLELINEILDLATIESGKLPLSMAPMSLSEVLLDCRSMIEPQAKKSGIRIRFPPFEPPWFVNADRTRVKQILINLLSNAIKYNRTDGTVEVTCSANETQRMRISVQDTGDGLPPAKIAQLFQPFNRLGQEAKTAEGTGIGLAVSKRLIEAMGGEIGMESIVGVGSIFWIELKLACEPQLEADADW
jgi:signal transduction histidine kinase